MYGLRYVRQTRDESLKCSIHMQTVYFDNRWLKEKLLFEMINLVKVFSVFVIVLSIVLVTLQICETAKRDFKLKNIFRFMDDKKINKKPKKGIKQLKDFKVHYFEGNNADKMIPAETRQHIHTLMPLPLPVHLPIPPHPEHFVENRFPPPPPPPPSQTFPLFHPEHLSVHHDSHYHDPYLEHDSHHDHHNDHHHDHSEHHAHSNGHMISEGSSPIIRPLPPPIFIHQEFNHIPVPIHNHLEERIAFPVFEMISQNNIHSNGNGYGKRRLHPNGHSYGDNNHSIRTNLDNDFMEINSNKHINDNKQRISKENKSSQTTARLVNNRKFTTIHNFNIKSNLDKFYDQENSNSQNIIKSNENSKQSNESRDQNHKNIDNDRELSHSDNRVDEKVYSEAIPDEQIVNIVEDEWTFKDLDLWLIR